MVVGGIGAQSRRARGRGPPAAVVHDFLEWQLLVAIRPGVSESVSVPYAPADYQHECDICDDGAEPHSGGQWRAAAVPVAPARRGISESPP